MNNRHKKAKLISRACSKSISTTETIVENVKVETPVKEEVKPKQEQKPSKNAILEEKIKQHLIKNHKYNIENVKYKFEILSYGYVTDIIECTEKERAIRYYLTFDDSYDYAYRFYINDNRIDNKRIKEVLDITYDMQIDYWRTRSRT